MQHMAAQLNPKHKTQYRRLTRNSLILRIGFGGLNSTGNYL